MGQSSSRNRPPPTAPQADISDSAQPEASSSTQREERDLNQTSRSARSLANKRTRRSSLRRSILGLIPHSSSGSLRSNSSEADSTQPPKKRWRSSRRWSKAPAHLSELPDRPERSHTGPPQVGGIVRAADVPSVSSGSNVRPSTSDTRSGPRFDSWTSAPPHMGDPTSDNLRHPGDEDIDQEITEFLENVERPDENATPDAHLAPPSPEPLQTAVEPSPSPARQFPPPGTLVVVQGVVNTTDTPSSAPPSSSSTLRPSRSGARRPVSAFNPPAPASVLIRRSASTPRTDHQAEERHGTRSRLPSFISRSSNLLGRRPSSDGEPRVSQDSHSTGDMSGSSDLTSNMTHDHSAEESSATGHAAEDQDASRSENDGRPRPLSPGSIDVLGTLLSVAAAATAASLFSPSLAFSSANAAVDGAGTASQFAGSNRPMSPTPTAGLGTLGGLGGLAGLGLHSGSAAAGLPMQGQRDGRDRIRNVWESFRDRLGLNARNASLPGVPIPANGAPQDDIGDGEPRMRPGELMLAEMARALNIGLGLNGDGTPVSGRSPEPTGGDASAEDGTTPASGTEGDRPLPPEDSFERFLINLQTDLRAALTENTTGESESNDPSPPAPAEDALESPHEISIPVATDAASDEHDAGPSTEGMDDGPPPLASLSDESDTDYDDDGDDEDDGEMVEDDGEDDAGPRHAHTARTPTPIPGSGLPFGVDQRQPQRDGTERRPPGINLWRLYRFQPIPASHTQVQAHAASTSRAASANSNTDASASQPEGSGTLPSLHSVSVSSPPQDIPHDESVSSPSSPFLPPTDPDANNNVVVPVIVVGLQSVDVDMAHTHENDHDDPMPADEMRGSESGSFDEPRNGSAASADGHMGGGAPARGRTWQSRAANALRTLRPGRRGGSRGRQNGDGTGSRTFLIYVIGGYYPPNHHMVTGSDSLDSYEALWELAELLGQVKPPVASREDIDKSGLQIITVNELAQFEKEGRVASNCTERCLICLDDYAEDDDLRLMSCKHAFHKKCVDKWLQVGRNNCPACRTKGVSTPGDSNP